MLPCLAWLRRVTAQPCRRTHLQCSHSQADGALHVTLQCAQPLSGARLVAGVVHLAPSEYRAAAERGKPPGLSAGYEVGGRLKGCKPASLQCMTAGLHSVLEDAHIACVAICNCAGPAAHTHLAGAAGACGAGGRAAAAQGAVSCGHQQPAGAEPGACAAATQQGAGRWALLWFVHRHYKTLGSLASMVTFEQQPLASAHTDDVS